MRESRAEGQARAIVLQPRPLSLKRLYYIYASFLNSNPAPERYRPESVDTFVTQWVESSSGSESYRERHCRSDGFLGQSDGDLISRKLTKSAPNMEYTKDPDGFTVPLTPASTGSRSYSQSIGPFNAAGG